MLADARKKVGLTQQDLARKLRKPQSFVSNYEKGQRRIDVLELLRIADALKADPQAGCGAARPAEIDRTRSERWTARGGVGGGAGGAIEVADEERSAKQVKIIRHLQVRILSVRFSMHLLQNRR